MFLHLCLITAGLHLGRSLLKSWKEAAPEPGEDTGSVGDIGSAGDPEGGKAVPAYAALPAAPEPQAVAVSTEAAEIEEQLDLALVSTAVTTATTLFFPSLRLLGGVSVLYGGIPIMARARQLLFEEQRIGAEVLDTVGMLMTLATRHYVSSSFMFLFYAGGRKLRLMTERAAQESMIDAFSRRSDRVWLLKDGVEVSVALESLRAGDVVVVDAGSPIPVDGIITRGAGLVDQQILTGEAQPLEKSVGDQVFAATVVFSGRFHVQVVTTGTATAAAEIAEMLRNTADFTSTLEARGQKIADTMALPTLALSAFSFPFVGGHGSVALLNSSFLDSMRLFIPFSMLNHLRRAHDLGILVKDGRSLQLLPEVDTIVFDKTGTLTLEQPRASRVVPAGAAGETDVLLCAAAAEHRQTHPIARAILDEVVRLGHSVPAIDETEYEVGLGLTARIGKQALRVGSKRFMATHRITVPELLAETEKASHARGCSLVYVARAKTLLGVIELEPTLRPEVESVLRALRKRGFALYLMSGDHEAPTRALAQALGFDHCFAGVLPRDKAQRIEDLQAQGRKVCFVGDGINDAIALKKAAVSISMGGASAAAVDSAQIILTADGLTLLPTLFELADGYRDNVQNIMIALGIPSAIGIGRVFLAGFRIPAMTTLYGVSMAAGVAVAMWPHRHRAVRRTLPHDEAAAPQLPAASVQEVPDPG